MASYKSITAAMRAEVSEHMSIWSAGAYQVIAYDEGGDPAGWYQTRSVMTPRLNDLGRDQWLDEARALMREVELDQGRAADAAYYAKIAQ